MTKEEIAAGLKKAIERGESLEKAKQTFINAGYNQKEVEEAAASFGGVLTNYPQPSPAKPAAIQPTPKPRPPLRKPAIYPVQRPTIQPHPIPRTPKSPSTQSESRKFIFILILIFIVLLGCVAATIFFREEIISFISDLL